MSLPCSPYAVAIVLAAALLVTACDRSHEAAATDYRALHRCLLGSPLASGESASSRVHRIAIATPLTREGTRAARASTWPGRCAQHARAMRDHLSGTSDAELTRSRAQADELARALGSSSSGDDFERRHRTLIDDLLGRPPAALLGGAPASGPLPPPAARPLTLDAMHPIVADTSTTDDDTFLHGTGRDEPASTMLFGLEALTACAFLPAATGEEPFARARCRRDGTVRGAELRAFASDEGYDGVPPVLIGLGSHATSAGLRAWSGNRARGAWDGHVSAEGAVSLLVDADDDGGWRLRRLSSTGEEELALELPLGSSRPWIVAGHVMWAAPDDGSSTLTLRALEPAGGLGPPAAIPGAPPELRHASGCTFEGGSVAVAQDFDRARTAIVFQSAGGWTGPVSAPARMGTDTVTCGRGEARFTWIEGPHTPTVHQVRCTPSGCRALRETVAQLDSNLLNTSALWLGTIDDAVLVAWSDPGGGVRMRLAPVGRLGQASETVLLDDAEHGGARILDARILQGRGVAVLVLQVAGVGTRGDEAYAIRIAADATFGAIGQ